MLTDVAVQFGAVSDAPHNRTLLAVSVAPDPETSFVNGFTVCVAPCAPLESSGTATDAGMNDGEYVDDAFEPSESVML